MHGKRIRNGLTALLLTLAAGPAAAGEVELLSRVVPGLESETAAGDSAVVEGALSADGRYLAFQSDARNLVPGQGGSQSDIFLFDRLSGTLTLVSRAAGSPATGGNGGSFAPQISADGRYVVYLSQATDLVAGQTDVNLGSDIFLFDRLSGANTLVSHSAAALTTTGSQGSFIPRMSSDGRYVAFLSDATDLVAGQTEGTDTFDVFLFDRDSAAITLVTHSAGSATTAADASSFPWGLSGDGRYVLFESAATDLVAGPTDGNDASDVFLFDRAAGTTTLVSHAAGSPTTAAGGASSEAAISDDGAWIVFASAATDLVAGVTDGNSGNDLFLQDRVSGLALSADGAWLGYDSFASHLAAGDRNGRTDVLLHERASGDNTLVSRHASGQASSTALELFFAPSASEPAVPSADGRFVAFSSHSFWLVPGQVDAMGERDVFLHDRTVGANLLVSRAAGTAAATANDGSGAEDLSADGRFVAFLSDAGNLVPGQVGSLQQVFRFDRATGTNVLLSRALGTTATAADGLSGPPSISADGSRVAFASGATNLTSATPPPCCGFFKVYVYDGSADAVFLLSREAGSTAPALGNAHSPRISADGRYVVYLCDSTNLVPRQTGGGQDNVYLTEVATGATLLVSHASASPATPGNQPSVSTAVSADGRFVAFASHATNLVPGQIDLNGGFDVFLFDRLTGTNRLVSGAGGSPAATGDKSSLSPAISADGRFVAFTSDADDLVPGSGDEAFFDGNDVFLFDRVAGTLTLVSDASGAPEATADGQSYSPTISADGGAVAFLSQAGNLVDGQVGGAGSVNVFLYDRLTGRKELASHVPGSETTASTGIADSQPRVSADGRHVAFTSTAGDLDEHDFNGLSDVFLYSRALPPGLDFFTLTACRRLDTRQPGQGPALASDVRRTVVVAGGCGVPASARAVAVNLTVTQPTGAGHLAISPGDSVASPTASAINFSPGQTRANNAVLSLPDGGAGTLNVDPFVLGGGSVHLIVDVVGYFE